MRSIQPRRPTRKPKSAQHWTDKKERCHMYLPLSLSCSCMHYALQPRWQFIRREAQTSKMKSFTKPVVLLWSREPLCTSYEVSPNGCSERWQTSITDRQHSPPVTAITPKSPAGPFFLDSQLPPFPIDVTTHRLRTTVAGGTVRPP